MAPRYGWDVAATLRHKKNLARETKEREPPFRSRPTKNVTLCPEFEEITWSPSFVPTHFSFPSSPLYSLLLQNHLGKQIEIKEIGWCSLVVGTAGTHRWKYEKNEKNEKKIKENQRKKKKERKKRERRPLLSRAILAFSSSKNDSSLFLSSRKRNDDRVFHGKNGEEELARKKEKKKTQN